MKQFVPLIFAFLALTGCANLTSIYRTFDISNGESPLIDIRQRAILVAPKSNNVGNEAMHAGKGSSDTNMVVCAEPSPDAMAALAYELATKGSLPGKGSGELAFAMQDSAAFTGIRTQSIQLLRDFGYRLCESYLSGAITPAQYELLMRRLQKNIVALLAIEQLTGTLRSPPIVLTSSGIAEVTKSLAEQRAEREKLSDQISELEKKKNELKDKADPKSGTTELGKKISALEEKIQRLRSDQEAIDKAITQTKGILANGKTEVTIKIIDGTSSIPTKNIGAVAKTVEKIVRNIVLSDDIDQLCMLAFRENNPLKYQKEFAKYCIGRFHDKNEQEKIHFDRSRVNTLDRKPKKINKAKGLYSDKDAQ